MRQTAEGEKNYLCAFQGGWVKVNGLGDPSEGGEKFQNTCLGQELETGGDSWGKYVTTDATNRGGRNV